MNKTEKYIYGIINSNEEKSFTPEGITTGEKVYTIPGQDISAVVSDSQIVDYDYMTKDALARHLIKHQQVIEGIMPEYTIIPMKLGTFASDKNQVKDILSKGGRVIQDVFAKISHKIEIDLTATWSDFNAVLKEVGEEKEIKEFKERLLTNPKEITVENQMKVGAMVKKALDEKREKYAELIQNALKTLSQDLKTHELMDDKMIINTAFLIDKDKQKDFDLKIEELDIKFAEKLNFRCVGPLPPYSFYTLEVKKMEWEEIEWARERLGLLNDVTTKDEIKRTYQRLAFSFHPDKNPDVPDIGEEFDEITTAYHILVDYGQALEQAGQKERRFFKEEEFEEKAILLVKVRE
ncbi:MAG: GvpL/GvpF family gas vesicle protein [bacterium]